MMQHILITGAAGALGKVVTEKFLDQGYLVSAFISKQGDPGFPEHPMLRIVRADLMNPSETEEKILEAAEAGAGIQAGILLVGGFAMGGILETSLEDLEKMYNLNFLTSFNTARPLLRIMEKQESGGQLIFTGARPAFKPDAARQMVSYAFSKSLVFRLAEVINSEGKKKGISASVIVPSIIDTPANRQAMPEAEFSRWVTPEQVADNLLHLISPSGRKLRKTILKIYGDS